MPVFTFLLLRDTEKGCRYVKRKYCSYFLLQSCVLNVNAQLVSWLIQRKRGYPISLERVSAWPFRHVRYLSTQTLSLGKHAQLPLTSLEMTPSSRYKCGLYTTSYFPFSLLYQRSGDWLFFICTIFFQYSQSALYQECTLMPEKGKKSSLTSNTPSHCAWKYLRSEWEKCQWTYWGKIQCTQETICTFNEMCTHICLACLNVPCNDAKMITLFAMS